MGLINAIQDLGMEALNSWKDMINVDNKLKFIGAGMISTGGILAARSMNKKIKPLYLDYKINDCYNPKFMTKHVWLSGVQGSGKSNKLRRIFTNTFIKQGYGGIYIDTHGTADEVLLSIPPERWRDVIYIAPWMGRTWGINILQRNDLNNLDEIDVIAEDIVDVFSKLYSRSWGDKISNSIRFAIKAILLAHNKNPNIFHKQPTLLDVYKLLKYESYRNKIIKYVDNIIISDFFESYKSNTAVDKLIAPLSSENVLVSLCQKDGFNILDAMNNNKIIICNLDNDKLSSNANLIAGLILSTITKCAAKRKEDDEKRSPYFAIAMDEFYEYANKHIAVLISQMRKKNICVLLANQYRDQTPQKEIQSAISMCQFKFFHTPADSDLKWIQSLYKDYFTNEQIIKLPFYHCIHDEHNPFKSREPFITPVPIFKGDYDWSWAHKLKFVSLHFVPHRYKVLEQLYKENVEEYTDDLIFGGEIII